MQIDYSQLQTFIDCPHKYHNKFILNLAKIQEGAESLDKLFGKAVHLALELLYKGKPLVEAKNAFRESYLVELGTEKAKTPANGERLIEAYWNYWQKPVSELSDTNLETVSVEVVDKFNITEEIEYIVKIDRVVKNNAGIWCMDHKSTRKTLYSFFNKFSPNMQVSGYCAYAKQKFGQCSGFIPNALKVGYRERAYKGEPAGFHCAFERDIVNRDDQQLRAFRDNVLWWCANLKYATTSGVMPRNENNCGYCQYRDLCNSCDDPNVRDTLYEVVDTKEYLKDGSL